VDGSPPEGDLEKTSLAKTEGGVMGELLLVVFLLAVAALGGVRR